MEKYKCEKCGKNHTVYRSLEIPLPRVISSMSESEREKRVREVNGFYYVDEELMFAHGWVNIEVENYDFPFYYWKTWTSISKDKFTKSLDILKTGQTVEFEGKMEEELPFYPGSIGLSTKTLIQATNDGIIVEILATGESQLKQDQSKAVSEKRMIEIMQMIHHNPKSEERRKNLSKPFSERLAEAIKIAKVESLSNKKDFVIDISSYEGLFQIVSNQMLENKGETNGFGIDLPFDDSFEETKDQIERFKLQAYSKDFELHLIDDIETYQIDLGINENRMQELVKRIVEDVYLEKLKTTEVEHMEI